MDVHVISNAVPTPEEMGKLLGLAPERVARVRSIMDAPGKASPSTGSGKTRRKSVRSARKNASRISSKR